MDSLKKKAANTTAASQRYEKMRLKRRRNGKYVPRIKAPRKKATVNTAYTMCVSCTVPDGLS